LRSEIRTAQKNSQNASFPHGPAPSGKKIYAVLAAAFAMVVVRFVFEPQLSLTI